MRLSDRDILAAMAEGTIEVTPFAPENLQGASLDLRLGNDFTAYTTGYQLGIDPRYPRPAEEEFEQYWVADGLAFSLPPFSGILAQTLESVRISPAYSGELEGKSSKGREFLIIHATARYVDPGWCGGRAAPLTYEIVNLNANRIHYLVPGMTISQIVFSKLSSPAMRPYGQADNHYVGSKGIVPSRTHPGYEKYLLAPGESVGSE